MTESKMGKFAGLSSLERLLLIESVLWTCLARLAILIDVIRVNGHAPVVTRIDARRAGQQSGSIEQRIGVDVPGSRPAADDARGGDVDDAVRLREDLIRRTAATWWNSRRWGVRSRTPCMPG